MRVIPIEVPELGNRSYLVSDGGKLAIVIDASRRIQPILDLASKNSLTIRAVFETHIHNDYLTGGYGLSTKLKVPYFIADGEKTSFKHQTLKPNQVIEIGKLKITALSSSGHTKHHLSFLVSQEGSRDMLFSGGSLLYGTVGRTDLVSDKETRALAKSQYQTARFFKDQLDPKTELYPTHGFGSFCAPTTTDHLQVSTLAEQLKTNSVYTSSDQQSFIDSLINSLDDYPSYYSYMAPLNLKGPLAPKLTKAKLLDKQTVLRAMHTGAAVIDMRSRRGYAAKHLNGTYNIELSSDFATYVGWLFAQESPIILVAATAKEIDLARERLSLIGREIIVGKITPTELLKATSQPDSYPIGKFRDLKASLDKSQAVTVLDVRRRLEWQKGHLPLAKHIALHELQNRLNELRTDQQIWVHCASGFRASIAASIIASSGRAVVLIDDNYSNAKSAGLLPIKKQKYVRQINKRQATLLDVRDQTEWLSGHAKDAVHIPVAKLLSSDSIDIGTARPVYVYCQSGQRSEMAANFLNSQGYHAHNIGGLDDWLAAGGQLA